MDCLDCPCQIDLPRPAPTPLPDPTSAALPSAPALPDTHAAGIRDYFSKADHWVDFVVVVASYLAFFLPIARVFRAFRALRVPARPPILVVNGRYGDTDFGPMALKKIFEFSPKPPSPLGRPPGTPLGPPLQTPQTSAT